MLAAAQAQLEKLEQQPRPEELPGSAAKVREAEARVQDEQDRFARSSRLREQKVISDEDFMTRRQSLAVAREQLAKMRADDELLRAGAWKPDLVVARAAVAQARAQLEQTQTELERLTVKAPRAGRILQVKVRAGEYVAQPSSSELMILGHVDPLYVRVDIDEAEIPRFRQGLAARGFVRGDTEHPVDLQFVRVEPYVIPKKSLSGANTERVDTRVLQALYVVEASEQELYVGQQLDVFVDLTARNQREKSAGSQSDVSPLAVKSTASGSETARTLSPDFRAKPD
jgi:multidrug resistance efflux pump